jgi:hypothetical protein
MGVDVDATRELLGREGQTGVVLPVLGVLVVASVDRRAGLGTVLVLAGLGLVSAGVVDTALEETGLEGTFYSRRYRTSGTTNRPQTANPAAESPRRRASGSPRRVRSAKMAKATAKPSPTLRR